MIEFLDGYGLPVRVIFPASGRLCRGGGDLLQQIGWRLGRRQRQSCKKCARCYDEGGVSDNAPVSHSARMLVGGIGNRGILLFKRAFSFDLDLGSGAAGLPL